MGEVILITGKREVETMMTGAPGVNRRGEDRDQRQARIESAAEQVFASRGVAAATMDDIARQSGVSKGALYLHFESKEQLYLQLALRALRELLSQLELLPPVGTGFERISAIVRTYAEFSLNNPARFRMAGAWMARDWQLPATDPLATEYAEVIKRGLRLAVDAFEMGKSDGSIGGHLNTQLTILQTIGGIHGIAELYAKLGEDSQEMPPQLDPQLWAGLLPNANSQPPTPDVIVTSYVELLLTSIGAAQ